MLHHGDGELAQHVVLSDDALTQLLEDITRPEAGRFHYGLL
jgi:hypothetical protein